LSENGGSFSQEICATLPKKSEMRALRLIIPAIALIALVIFTSGNGKDNWTPDQLMPVEELAEQITQHKAPIILNIGPAGNIKTAKEIGSVNTPEQLEKLRNTLKTLDKNQAIVVYCGCCPFKNCPNIRPAMGMLAEMNFSNYKLLNIPQNLKVDWIDKGYPVD
jgi:thiosulfate/3-mercaptopyruvate sulfurtransferase